MRADLHIHSRYSDGGLWPAEIAGQAAAAGLEAACVADHETLGGYPEFAAAARRLGLRTWPAVEIDCVDPKLSYKSEILAYFPDERYAGTEAFLAAGRAERAERLAALFERAGTLFSLRGFDFRRLVERRSAGHPSGSAPEPSSMRFSKTDLFAALRDAGALPADVQYRDFKKAYYDTGLFSDLRFSKPELASVAERVAKDGGALVVPHVGHEFGDSLRIMATETDRLDGMLKRFRDLGIGGVELYDYRNPDSEAINALVMSRCAKFGFFYTYGSDSHGPGSAKDGVGGFYGDFKGFPGPARRRKD